MDDLVCLLDEMGAGELARQYRWWTMKSQPNALKRTSTDPSPCAGLTAIDFRAGLTLLPFLPMSPADFPLIVKGLCRGRVVQFDRSDLQRLDRFMQAHADDFQGLEPAVAELRERDRAYRRSMPDVTHHHLRLLIDSDLRGSIKRGAITSWKNLGRIDRGHAERLQAGTWLFLVFYLLSHVPLLGKRILRLWGDDRTRQHVARSFSSFRYLLKAMEGARIETLVVWQRQGRMRDDRVAKLVRRPVRFWAQRILFGWLPSRFHRFLTEPSYAWGKIREAARYTVRILRVPSFREEVLLEQVGIGRKEGMLTEAEAERVEREIKDPYIQKYLRCLAVHVCTVPVTQVVMLIVGALVLFYCVAYKQLGWPQSMAYGTAAAAAIQLMPISPGSIARGLFVIYMMIKDRDVKNYWIAAPVSFLHVVGYLAFPLQMASHNPALARFLAGRWTMSLARVVPVFGERGGLLEHSVFDFFFNLPLSIHRGFKTSPASWALGSTLCAGFLAGIVFLGYGCAWEQLQSGARLEGAKVTSIVPYTRRGGDLHWTSHGVLVHFEGQSEPVDFPADKWDASLKVGDLADAVIRKSFLGKGYDGLAVSRRWSPVEMEEE
jgi:hypothetical protein